MKHHLDKALAVLLVLTLAFVVFDSGFDPLYASLSACVAILAIAVLAWRSQVELRAREETAAVLGSQKELFRTTLANIGDAVIACDESGRITFMNPAAETLTRWRAELAEGVPIADVVRVVDDTHQPVECLVQLALRKGVAVPALHRGRLVARGSNYERPVEDSASPVRDAEGRIVGAVLVFRDVTERKESEDALREADRRKDEFLAVLAHELRNPLAPLRNALHILRMSGHDETAVEQVSGMMDRQLRQMVRLIDDLLDVSRISSNKLELRREVLRPFEAIEAAIEMSAPAVQRSGQRVEVVLSPGCPMIEADRARLVQVLDNLLVNAAKYGRRGGLITVHAEPRGGDLCLRVKDEGIGIPRDMLERVFEMFTQVDRSLERSRGGLGIGLTLVRRIVQLHGGSVVAKSAGPEKGSEIVVLLPALPARVDLPQVARRKTTVRGPALRIAVTDDNEDSAASMAGALRALGHDVRVAFDGTQCIDVCRGFQPQVLLLDIGMPKLNGYDTARIIRMEPWGAEMLIVAMTGWGQEEDRRRALDAGFDHHLVKPVDFDALLAILRTVSKHEPASQAVTDRA
ncbi:MAG TPA: ATP-binding protein [Usitatibacter sp.]|nr:ATP-binding protein [Usitatibacter sp.]